MKNAIISVFLFSAMLLGSCSDTTIENPSPEQEPKHNEGQSNGEPGLVRITPNPEWDFVELGVNELNIVRNEDELKTLIEEDSYVASGIDFGNYSLLLVRVYAGSGISEISYDLQTAESGYIYSMQITLNATCVISDEICAVLTSVILPEETVSFDFEIK